MSPQASVFRACISVPSVHVLFDLPKIETSLLGGPKPTFLSRKIHVVKCITEEDNLLHLAYNSMRQDRGVAQRLCPEFSTLWILPYFLRKQSSEYEVWK